MINAITDIINALLKDSNHLGISQTDGYCGQSILIKTINVVI